jgi:hypothetical protein
VIGWMLYIFLEIIEITLILLTVVPELLSILSGPGVAVGVGYALTISVITLLLSIARFDIIGSIFGIIGLIPFMGSIVRGLSKGTTSAASTLRKIIVTGAKKVGLGASKTQKLLKITEPLLRASKFFDSIDDLMKLMKFGTNITKITKSSDGVNDIITALIKSPDEILDVVSQIAKKKKVASELSETIVSLSAKYGDDTVNMANKLLSSIPLDSLVDIITIIKNVTSKVGGSADESIVAITKVIKFGNKHGTKSQKLFKVAVKTAKYLKRSSIKKVKGVQGLVNRELKKSKELNVLNQ